MYIVGEEEIDALAKLIRSGKLFRYGVGGECDRFESRYAEYLGVSQFALTVSGTNFETVPTNEVSLSRVGSAGLKAGPRWRGTDECLGVR